MAGKFVKKAVKLAIAKRVINKAKRKAALRALVRLAAIRRLKK